MSEEGRDAIKGFLSLALLLWLLGVLGPVAKFVAGITLGIGLPLLVFAGVCGVIVRIIYWCGVDVYRDVAAPVYAGSYDYAPAPASTPAKKKKKKKRPPEPEPRPLPRKEPPRPKSGPRVQMLHGTRSHVWGRIHLDECASHGDLAKLLRKYGLEVTTTADVGLVRASDRKQLKHVVANRAIIVTFDKDFIDFHEAGEPHAGIIHSPQDKRYYHEILRVCLRMSQEVAER